MTAYFSVRNYETFQHYKDRNPPWIKLYNSLLDSYEFAQLPDASKAHLLAIYLLASRSNNKIPADSGWLKSAIHATENIDLPMLVKYDFIVPDQECSEMLARCTQNAPQRRVEGEGESKSSVSNETGILPLDPIKIYFDTGCALLAELGAGKTARSLLGRLRQGLGDDVARAQSVVDEMAVARPSDPASWLMARIPRPKRSNGQVDNGTIY